GNNNANGDDDDDNEDSEEMYVKHLAVATKVVDNNNQQIKNVNQNDNFGIKLEIQTKNFEEIYDKIKTELSDIVVTHFENKKNEIIYNKYIFIQKIIYFFFFCKFLLQNTIYLLKI